MNTKTQQKIQSTLKVARELEKVVGHLNQLEQRMEAAQQKKDKLIQLVNKEEQDVAKLESLSLKGLFYKVLGSKEEQVEKERQEYLQAFMQLEEHNKEIEFIEFEQKVLEEKRLKHAGIKEELERLKAIREKELIKSGAPAGQRLLKIENETDRAEVVIWEIGEAMQEGGKAVQLLEEMMHFLKGARNWGQWGNQRNKTWQNYQRRSNIDKARERGYYAKQQLLKFQRELKDLYNNPSNYAEALQLDFYQGFLANLFNNLLSDWVLQQKIKNSLGLVHNVRDQVAMELARLDREKHKLQNSAKQLNQEKNSILLTK